MPELYIDLPDLSTGLPQALTPENSEIAGKGLGIVLAGRRIPGGIAAWKVLVFRGLDQHDPYVVWTIWKDQGMWQAISGRYTDDLERANAVFRGAWAGDLRHSPAL